MDVVGRLWQFAVGTAFVAASCSRGPVPAVGDAGGDTATKSVADAAIEVVREPLLEVATVAEAAPAVAAEVAGGADAAAIADAVVDAAADAGADAAPDDSAPAGDATATLPDAVALADVATFTDAQADAAPDASAPPDCGWWTMPAPLAATGGWVAWPAALPANFDLPIGVPVAKPGIKPYPHTSSALIDDLDGDDQPDLVLWAESGALRVIHGPLSPQAQVEKLPMPLAGDPRVHSVAVIETPGGGKRLLVGGDHVAAFAWGNGQWLDQASAVGLPNKVGGPWRRGISVADVDNDGLLDVLVAHYNCGAQPAHEVWLDRGDGIVEERAQQLGMTAKGSQWGVAAADWDGDGDADIVWMHDGCADPKTTQVFYRNLGRGADGFPLLQRQAPSDLFSFLKAKMPFASPMGIDTGDFDNDGLPDLAVANIGLAFPLATAMKYLLTEDPTLPQIAENNLLQSLAGGDFDDVGLAAGLKTLVDPEKQLDLTAWGVRWLDFDRDGRLDLWLANAPESDAYTDKTRGPMRPVLLRNLGFGTFGEVSAAFGMPKVEHAPVVATGDLDGDNDEDAVLGQLDGQPLILRNEIKNTPPLLRVRLQGTLSNRSGRGARVQLVSACATQTQVIGGDATYTTHHAPEAAFALPELPAKLVVRWPSGFEQTSTVQAGGLVKVDEPPLVTVSARFVAVGDVVTVTGHSFDSAGQPLAGNWTIAAVPVGSLSLQGAANCDAKGACAATFKAAKTGTTFLKITLGALALQTWPKVTVQ